METVQTLHIEIENIKEAREAFDELAEAVGKAEEKLKSLGVYIQETFRKD